MEQEDTIELIDLLRVLWKWKWFIIIFALACAIAAGIITFSMAKVYEVSMIIEPGVIDIGPNGNFIYLDSSSNVESKIDSQAYNRRIFDKLHADPKKVNRRFRTTLPKNSNALKVSLEAGDPNKGIQALSILFHELVKEYKHYIDSRKSELDQGIAMNRRQLDVGAAEKKYLEKEIAIVKANTDRIIAERDMLLKKRDSNPDNLSLLIYTNIIQQNMIHYNDLNQRLSELMTEIEKTRSEADMLQIKKESIENIRLIQEPESSIYPIKPKKKLNIALAFVVGLFVSVFVAFFMDYLQKAKSYPATPTNAGQTPSIKNQKQ
jgi:LPS O-antigen subunit length determinant protein (WzzB/FepE family)